MNRLLAGIYDPLPAAQEAVTRALAREALVDAAREGPLTLAWTRSLEDSAGAPARTLCLLDGCIDTIGAVAGELGVAQDEAPEHVLAAAYERWGERMLERLRGRFALLVWDREEGQGLLAVDQLGSRPLFIHGSGARLVFASEVRDLLRLLPTPPSPDRAAVVQWLVGDSLPCGRTLDEGVRRLEGGSFLQLAGGRWTKSRYWSPRYSPPLPLSRSELAEELRAGIARAVRSRSGKDATIGILLSGGLDSSSVAAVARQLEESSGARLRAISALFPDRLAMDESALIESVTAHLGLSSGRVLVYGGSMLRGSLEFLRAWKVPSLSPSLLFILPLLRLAAEEGVSVLLDGEGGDELFGSEPFVLADRLRGGRLLSTIRLAGRFAGLGERPAPRQVWRLLREYGLKGAAPYAAHRTARLARGPAHYGPAWLTDESARLYFETSDPWAWKRSGNGAPRWWKHRCDELTRGRERTGAHDYLRRRAALAGIEGGHPFLDDLDLIELALRLPPELAAHSQLSRPLLRESMSRLLPDDVRLRREKGYFTELFVECLDGPDRAPVTRLLAGKDAEVLAYVRPDIIRDLLGAPAERRGGAWAWALWRLATAECWLRAQAEPLFPDRVLESWGLHEPRYELIRG